MYFLKHKPFTQAAARHLSDRIQPVETPDRFYWRLIPGSEATLELAHGAEALDETIFCLHQWLDVCSARR